MLNPDLLPVEGNRVRLRPLAAVDAVRFAEGAADPLVRSHAHLPEPEYTPSSVEVLIRRDVTPGLQRGDLAVLAIADRDSDQFAGSLVLFDVHDGFAEVGFWLHPDRRGAGVAAAAIEQAVRFARDCGLAGLTARTAAENPASQRTLTAAGFTVEGRGVGTAPSGVRVELLHYARTL